MVFRLMARVWREALTYFSASARLNAGISGPIKHPKQMTEKWHETVTVSGYGISKVFKKIFESSQQQALPKII